MDHSKGAAKRSSVGESDCPGARSALLNGEKAARVDDVTDKTLVRTIYQSYKYRHSGILVQFVVHLPMDRLQYLSTKKKGNVETLE